MCVRMKGECLGKLRQVAGKGFTPQHTHTQTPPPPNTHTNTHTLSFFIVRGCVVGTQCGNVSHPRAIR